MWPMQLFAVLWIFLPRRFARGGAALAGRSASLDVSAGWAAAWFFYPSILCRIAGVWRRSDARSAGRGRALLPRPRGERDREKVSLWLFFCGLCASLASLYKHQGAIILVAFGSAFVIRAGARRPEESSETVIRCGIVSIATISIGFAIPWLACIGIYAALHQLPAFFEWVFTRNLRYAGKGVAGSAVKRGLQRTLLCCGGTILPWIFAVRATVLLARSDRSNSKT